eukprot:symbB.v1.2.002020.t1/scaffold87.1/size343203/16
MRYTPTAPLADTIVGVLPGLQITLIKGVGWNLFTPVLIFRSTPLHALHDVHLNATNSPMTGLPFHEQLPGTGWTWTFGLGPFVALLRRRYR